MPAYYVRYTAPDGARGTWEYPLFGQALAVAHHLVTAPGYNATEVVCDPCQADERIAGPFYAADSARPIAPRVYRIAYKYLDSPRWTIENFGSFRHESHPSVERNRWDSVYEAVKWILTNPSGVQWETSRAAQERRWAIVDDGGLPVFTRDDPGIYVGLMDEILGTPPPPSQEIQETQETSMPAESYNVAFTRNVASYPDPRIERLRRDTGDQVDRWVLPQMVEYARAHARRWGGVRSHFAYMVVNNVGVPVAGPWYYVGCPVDQQHEGPEGIFEPGVTWKLYSSVGGCLLWLRRLVRSPCPRDGQLQELRKCIRALLCDRVERPAPPGVSSPGWLGPQTLSPDSRSRLSPDPNFPNFPGDQHAHHRHPRPDP